MATTITASQFSVEITEKLTLGGVKKGSRVVSIESSISEVARRTMQVTYDTNGTSIMKFASTPATGTYDSDTFKYLRITNLDATVSLVLQLKEAGGQNVEVLIPAKKSFILNSLAIDAEADIDDAVMVTGSETLIDEILGKAASGSAVIEVEYIVVNS
jgi:hypothetical protein